MKPLQKEYDLFGDEIIKCTILRDRFIEPPFSVLDTKTGSWQSRKREWKSLGIKSEVGREGTMGGSQWGDLSANPRSAESSKKIASVGATASIFDPALCELMYNWFCPRGGSILDPFAGGSVRGIVAHKLGYSYTGIDIRPEQIESNREQAAEILEVNNQPNWYIGDSNEIVTRLMREYDLIFSCPPYADLEVYSDLDGDISNKPYGDFLAAYRSIISKSVGKLKVGGMACFVVGEIRNKKGNYVGFVQDTIKAFCDYGMDFYNDAVLLGAVGSASMRAAGHMKNKKLVKIHQNVLVFRKGAQK